VDDRAGLMGSNGDAILRMISARLHCRGTRPPAFRSVACGGGVAEGLFAACGGYSGRMRSAGCVVAAALGPGALLLGVATRYRAGEMPFISWVVILAPYVALTPCGDSTRFLLALR
jgi:hypothetical protein